MTGPTLWTANAETETGAPCPTLENVSIDIAVVLGTTSMPIHQVLRLGRGAIIELDASEEDEVSILANNLPVAKGTVIVSGNKIAVEVKQLLPRTPAGAWTASPARRACGEEWCGRRDSNLHGLPR